VGLIGQKVWGCQRSSEQKSVHSETDHNVHTQTIKNQQVMVGAEGIGINVTDPSLHWTLTFAVFFLNSCHI